MAGSGVSARTRGSYLLAGSAIFVTFQVQQQDKHCFNVCVNKPEAEGFDRLFSSDNLSLSLLVCMRVLASSLPASHLAKECGQEDELSDT